MIRTLTSSLFLSMICMLCFNKEIKAQNDQNAVQSIIESQSLRSLSTASEQTRKIYEWITQNIQYDTRKKYTISSSRDDYIELAEKVARDQKGVCLGYSALFKKLCDHLAIPAFVAKGKVFIPGEDELENHAWVVFKTEKGWALADPTWGSGNVSGHQFTFQQSWRFYELDPKEFIKTHYPFEPAFQLLDQAVTFNMFLNRSFNNQSDTLNYSKILDQKLSNPDPIPKLQRALKYKPEDSYLMHDLATYYQDKASELAKECVRIYNRNGKIPDHSHCNEDIQLAENYLKNAVSLFKKIIEQKAAQTQMAWMNLASAKNNLKTIEILKQNQK